MAHELPRPGRPAQRAWAGPSAWLTTAGRCHPAAADLHGLHMGPIWDQGGMCMWVAHGRSIWDPGGVCMLVARGFHMGSRWGEHVGGT